MTEVLLLYHPDLFTQLYELPYPLKQYLASGGYRQAQFPQVPSPQPYAPRYSLLWRWAAALSGRSGVTLYPPAGALRLASWDREIPSNKILIAADLLHLYPDLDQLRMLMPTGEDEVAEEESLEFVQACSQILSDHGLSVIAYRGGSWVLGMDPDSELAKNTRPEDLTDPIQAQGMPLISVLPQGVSGPDWRKLGNTLQIALHNARVNQARERRERTPLNSLWLWGWTSNERASQVAEMELDESSWLPHAEPWAASLLSFVRQAGVNIHWAKIDNLEVQIEHLLKHSSRIGLLGDTQYWQRDGIDGWKFWRWKNVEKWPWSAK